jgi:integrase/recombinase XerD
LRKKIDIHNWDRRYELTLARLMSNKRISDTNRKFILNFVEECRANNLSLARRVKYLYTLPILAERLGKDFDSVTVDGLKKLVGQINDDKGYADWTKNDFRVALKRFYQWLRKLPPGQSPPETAWIRVRSVKKKILPEELLTEDDVSAMLNACEISRDRAFVMTLYELGGRIGELLSLRRKSVMFDEFGAVLLLSGKTGDRRARAVTSTAYLSQWLNDHPHQDTESPLWVSLSDRSRGQALDYASSRMLLRRLAHRAGVHKRVNPQAFRHSRASFLANALTERQMEQYLGWVPGSRMPEIYVHLSGRDVDSAVLAMNGIEVAKPRGLEVKLRPKACARCEQKNDPMSKFCSHCGMPLDLKAALEIEKERKSADDLMSRLLKDPEVQQVFVAKLRRLALAADPALASAAS